MVDPDKIKSGLSKVNQRIYKALEKAGRRDDEVTLVGVTKTFPPEYLTIAIECGLTEIGENRVQEFEAKKPKVKGRARWHLIGHLQSNKVKKAIELFDIIQSVDSYKLAKEISKRADGDFEILIQVNSSGEESKFGLEMDGAEEEILKIAELGNIRIMGLMTIGRFVEDETLIRKSFAPVKEMFEELKKYESDRFKMVHLSMGMSSDFELAIEEGANMVRIGSLIFGSRG
ncbi:MAG TPA: YggS family pyridoxal phosphate-dependent enzyme [candidate division Zixibacteria bacterium]|nr:YggS family pyridoxal phosphate-dependent enzyme [candidate division Zixibacteria bacterium]